jgi:MOSC domain-containing protein YiiM
MKLISVNCGLPRQIDWHGTPVTTSIYKEPVNGRVALRTLNLDGDRQSDLRVHGGQYKAVYCYPIQHYDYWKAALPGRELPIGVFGENFTIDDGPDEDSVWIGDRFSVGTAEVVVTQPRMPCFKLGIRFGSDDMIAKFLASGRTGFYVGVTREGEVGAGDEIGLLSRESESIPVSAIMRLYLAHEYDDEDLKLIEKARKLSALPDSWKQWLWERANRRII